MRTNSGAFSSVIRGSILFLHCKTAAHACTVALEVLMHGVDPASVNSVTA